MKRIFKALLLLSASLLCMAASGQSISGNELMERLERKDISAAHYVMGIVDAAELSKSFFHENPEKLSEQVARSGEVGVGRLWGCRPERSTYGQVIDVFLAYAKKRPELRHLDASILIAFAMQEAWRCPA